MDDRMGERGTLMVLTVAGGEAAVLFRFVVMMLNVTGVEERKGEKEEGVGRREEGDVAQLVRASACRAGG